MPMAPDSATDPFAPFERPDYRGGSLLNLLSSVIHAHGGQSPHPEARALPAARLAKASTLVLLIVDGIGEEQLARYLEAGRGSHFFGAFARQTLSTVYPATTAAAITTLCTGAAPAEHAILGWHLHLPDLGLVSSILPATTRTDSPLAAPEFDLRAYLAIPAHLSTTRRKRVCLSYEQIATSRYSQAGTRWHETGSHATLDEMVRNTLAAAARKEPQLLHVYWPEYDTLCHEYGTQHPFTLSHLDEIDAALGRLARKLRALDAALLVCADHGLVDTPLYRRINLSRIPGLYDCLAMAPSGDTRSVHCFVRPRREAAFLDIVERELTASCLCLQGESLLSARLYGPGTEHPALRSRVGDYVLLARDDFAFSAPIWGGDGQGMTGNHGGMSAREMRVPLFALLP